VKPTVGRIVHYKSLGTANGEYPSTTYAAIITSVYSGNVVDLCVFYPNGLSFKLDIEYSERDEPGCWHWPTVIIPESGK
jgi:hypothetical protein